MPVLAVPALNPGHEIVEKTAFGESLAITVDNDAFFTTISNPEIILIDNRNMKSLLIALFNNAGTNSFDYEISGHAAEVATPPALNEPATVWEVLVAATAVANNASAFSVVSDDWAWIAIRLRRTTTTLNSIADVRVRGLKN